MHIQEGDVINDRYLVERLHPTPDSYLHYFLTRDLLLDRIVIVKMAALITHERFLARFEQEAHVLASLEHPHIVPIYDYGVYDGHPFQVQRFLSGGKVEDFFVAHKQGLSATETMHLAQQLGSALDYIHLRGISHRNINTSNVVLDDQNEPYLTNFTLAKLLDDEDDRDFQTLSDDDLVTEKGADLYAFGMLLYQGLTGNVPPVSYGEKIPSVRKFRDNLPLGVDLVFNRLFHEDSELRYGSARAAVDDLYDGFFSGHSRIDGKIFISYARADKEYVYFLVRELRNIGLDLWIDLDIPAGANWDQEIERALDECSKLLLIASPASMLSENVQDEWSYFLENGKAVYPYIYQECDLSFRLRRRQFITSIDDLMSDMHRIVDMLADNPFVGI